MKNKSMWHAIQSVNYSCNVDRISPISPRQCSRFPLVLLFLYNTYLSNILHYAFMILYLSAYLFIQHLTLLCTSI